MEAVFRRLAGRRQRPAGGFPQARVVTFAHRRGLSGGGSLLLGALAEAADEVPVSKLASAEPGEQQIAHPDRAVMCLDAVRPPATSDSAKFSGDGLIVNSSDQVQRWTAGRRSWHGLRILLLSGPTKV
jgi:hypothetical protein